MSRFADRLAASRPILLDGATGTELNRRGVDTSLPLWSAAAIEGAPAVLAQIHADYASAGAEVITANTFRTHSRNLSSAGVADRAAELTRRAVEIARQSAGTGVFVAGSQAPLEDCYSPDLTPCDAELKREHAAMAANLAASGVDLILVETQHTVREAAAAAQAAAETGLPILVSFVCGEDGRLLSGETLERAAAAVRAFQPLALLVNCAPAPAVRKLLEVLGDSAGGLPIGAYANIGRPDPVQGWTNTDAADPTGYARYAGKWLTAGARLVGGCCGTTPHHIAELARVTAAGGPRRSSA